MIHLCVDGWWSGPPLVIVDGRQCTPHMLVAAHFGLLWPRPLKGQCDHTECANHFKRYETGFLCGILPSLEFFCRTTEFHECVETTVGEEYTLHDNNYLHTEGLLGIRYLDI